MAVLGQLFRPKLGSGAPIFKRRPAFTGNWCANLNISSKNLRSLSGKGEDLFFSFSESVLLSFLLCQSEGDKLLYGSATRTEELLITRNLFGCLRVLTSNNYLWIDALCINQSDNVEREIQVPLMGSIYTNARHVIVWLGLEESDLEGFVWIHEVLYPRLTGYINAIGENNTTSNKIWDAVDFDINLGVESAAKWDDYSRFTVQRRWFRRA